MGLTEYRITFGGQYRTEPHPYFPAAHPDGWLTVLATDEYAARRAVITTIGPNWCGIYHPDDPWYPGSDRATALAGDVDYFPLRELGRLDATDPDHPRGLGTKPIVWAWCNNAFGTDDQAWVAISDDGRLIAQHVSSNREWGQHDVGPTGGHARDYLRVLGTVDVLYRVQPDGDGPPPYVLERLKKLHPESTEGQPEDRP